MTFIKEYEKSLFECCECGWIGEHDEKATREEKYCGIGSVVDICPKCDGEDFYRIIPTTLSGDNND